MKSITEQFEEIKEEMCDKYCKYPHQVPPEANQVEYLLTSDDSPCLTCPMTRL